MRLLVVEDDPTISHFLVKGLREEGYVVDLAEEGPAAEEQALSATYDAILLDVLLPGRDGFGVCANLREAGLDTPVLMLTARDAVGDRVRGLDCGADDYLTKPFSFDELLARLRALLRRGRTRALTGVLSHGPLAVDTGGRRATLEGRPLELTAAEYRLLEVLVRRAGQILSREEIADAVFRAGEETPSNAVDVYVGYLRRKLGADAALIHTVRGLGYMLRADGGAGEERPGGRA